MPDLLSFFVFQILDQAPLFLGLIALIGLILQKKKATDVIDGVIKTIVGILVLSTGAGVLMNTLFPIMKKLNAVLGVQGVLPANEAVFGIAMVHLANAITLTFLIGFFIHLAMVYVMPFKRCKNIYLTVHVQFYLATFMIVSLPHVLPVQGAKLIGISSVLCALYWTLSPAITRKIAYDFVGDDLTLGHNQQVGAWLASKIAPIFGNKEQDAEEMHLPGFLSIFRDTTISLAILMPIIFIGIGIAIGREGVTALSGKTNWLVWLFLEGLTFTAGVVVLLTGVRMFIGSIVTAFKGISDKLIPNAVPALDCPAFFPYSPTGAMLGFISSVAGALIVMIITIVMSCPVIVFPSPIIMFFDGCTMGVFGNKFGGYKGAIAAGFITSFIAHLGVIFIYPMTGSIFGSGLTFSNIDYTLVWLPVFKALQLISGAF